MTRTRGEGDVPAGPRVMDWLLDPRQPAVRYHALVELLGRPPGDAEVRAARRAIGRTGWAADQLRRQGPQGFWERREPRTIGEWVNFLYFPKFRSTIWRAQVLSDLGLDSSDPPIRKVAELLFRYKLRLGSPVNFFYEEASIAGNTARMMTRFGYGDAPRVRKLYDWLVEDQRADGGWHGDQGAPGSLEAWEPLAAFASVPKAKRSPKMADAIERGAEFYLERRLTREAGAHPEWLRFHYPVHYFYDLLVGLDVLTQLGYASDRRLRPALEHLRKKRRSDGTWNLDRVHPEEPRGRDTRSEFRPLVIEPAGRPSRWITLKALSVLARVERAR